MKRCLIPTQIANRLLSGLMEGEINSREFYQCEVIIEGGKVTEVWSTDGRNYVSYKAVNEAEYPEELLWEIETFAFDIIEEAA